jgi:polyhydroxyalkanoate synthesis repressor PhaR
MQPRAGQARAGALRLIKKYPNRRLYDTQTSSYITLADVKELVLKHQEFQVLDAKSGDDLTRAILLQIILEEESAGQPMFSHDILTNFIRSYGNAMQGVMGSYLERNVQAFQEIQKRIQEQSRTLVGDSSKISEQLWSQFLVFQGPAMQSMMSAYMDQSKNMFQQMQEQLQTQTRTMFSAFPFNPFQGLPGQPQGEAEKPDPDKSDSQS